MILLKKKKLWSNHPPEVRVQWVSIGLVVNNGSKNPSPNISNMWFEWQVYIKLNPIQPVITPLCIHNANPTCKSLCIQNAWNMNIKQRVVQFKLTKLLLNLWTVKIKIFQRIHHTVVPFIASTHIISVNNIKYGKRIKNRNKLANMVGYLILTELPRELQPTWPSQIVGPVFILGCPKISPVSKFKRTY